MTPAHTISVHAGEGHPAPGVNAAMAAQTAEPQEVATGGVVDVSSALSAAVEQGSMGLRGWRREIGNASAMVVVCGILLYGIVFTIPETQNRFNSVVEAERKSHERQQSLDREMYDKHRAMVEDRADLRLEKFGRELRADIKDAIREALGK